MKPCKTNQQIALRKLIERKHTIFKKQTKDSCTVVIQDRQEYIETGLEHHFERDTYNELEDKQVAKESQAVRAMYQDGNIDKLIAEYLSHKW